MSHNGKVGINHVGLFHAAGGVRTKTAITDVSNPPTDAELDAAFGTPATVGDGFIAGIDDDNRFWMVFALGGAWAVEEFAKAS